MIVCNSCGKQNLTTEYCQFCGARIMEKCPVCDGLHPVGAIHCPMNGGNIKEFVQRKEAEQEAEQRKKEEEERVRHEELDRERGLWLKYRECYKGIREERFFYYIGSLLVSLIGSAGLSLNRSLVTF